MKGLKPRYVAYDREEAEAFARWLRNRGVQAVALGPWVPGNGACICVEADLKTSLELKALWTAFTKAHDLAVLRRVWIEG